MFPIGITSLYMPCLYPGLRIGNLWPAMADGFLKMDLFTLSLVTVKEPYFYCMARLWFMCSLLLQLARLHAQAVYFCTWIQINYFHQKNIQTSANQDEFVLSNPFSVESFIA